MSPRAPALISVDWGTSSFRAYLGDDKGGAIDEIASGEGALALSAGAHESYLAGQLENWTKRWPSLPVIASGMVGARQGWREAPYAPCPAGLAEIAAATIEIPTERLGPVRIVPGLSALDKRGAPDVMRGEETQILGALTAGCGDGIYVLPGTHSKWARVEEGRIVSFETFMTGEVFAVLKTHSVLGRMMADPERIVGEGFVRGLEAAALLERPGDLLHAIFATRSFGLFDVLPPSELGEYLSGLLIGAEIVAGAQGASRAVVIGSAALTNRYVEAGERLGITMTPAPANCATLGQLSVLGRMIRKA